MSENIRYARVIARREDEVANYLPFNYRVIGSKPSAEFEGRSEVPLTEHVAANRCATVGCKNEPTELVSYTYRGEGPEETELVCTPCADSYERRPVLTGFKRTPHRCTTCGCEIEGTE